MKKKSKMKIGLKESNLLKFWIENSNDPVPWSRGVGGGGWFLTVVQLDIRKLSIVNFK